MTTSYQSRLKLNENDSQYELTIELPGYSNKDVEVSVEDYVLTVKASNDKRGETLRRVSLWEGIDFEKVTGKIEDGVLTVKLPKVEKVKPKKIQIE
jgi:HSP20 family protein